MKYGRLTVLEEYKTEKNELMFRCLCDCGTVKDIRKSNVITGRTKSCGCYQREAARKRKLKTNEYVFDEELGCVKGKFTNVDEYFLIDKEDYEKVKDISWYKANTGYAINKNRDQVLLLHRLVTNAPEGLVVDHLNHVKTDNRKSNLRVCTQKENVRNRLTEPKCIYKIYRGERTYYVVTIRGKHIGCFKHYEDAKKVRDNLVAKMKKEVI